MNTKQRKPHHAIIVTILTITFTTTTTIAVIMIIKFVLTINCGSSNNGGGGGAPTRSAIAASLSHPRQLFFPLQLCQQPLPQLVHAGAVDVRTPAFDGKVRAQGTKSYG